MSDLIHKLIYTGIGLAALTEQKAQQIVAELEQKGEVSAADGKKLAQELVEKARNQRDELKKTISEEVDKIAGKLNWVSRADFDELKNRLDKLENRSSCCGNNDSL